MNERASGQACASGAGACAKGQSHPASHRGLSSRRLPQRVRQAEAARPRAPSGRGRGAEAGR
eukprot:1240504-Alexandrium_andersonii.AAC.1